MHLEDPRKKQEQDLTLARTIPMRSSNYANDDELMRIFERTYGKVQRKSHNVMKSQKLPEAVAKKYRTPKQKDGEFLLVDGYNILFSWFDLNGATSEDLDFARNYLINRLSNYKVMKNYEIIIVFDAYKVKNNPGSSERIGNVTVVYTKEAETADSYIERTAKEIHKNYDVTVATSDRLEQIIIYGTGAIRLSAEEFLKDVEQTEEKISDILEDLTVGNPPLNEIRITKK